MPDKNNNDLTQDRIGPLKRSFQTPHLEPAWTLLERLDPRPHERLLVVPARDSELLSSICTFHREGKVYGLEENKQLASKCGMALLDQDMNGTEVKIINSAYHTIPTPGGQDALICHCHMPVIRNLAQFIGSLGSNLRPGGRFCLQIPLRPFCQVLEDALYTSLDKSVALPMRDDLCPPADSEEILQLLADQRFREVKTEELIFLQSFDCVMEAADTVMAAGGWAGLEDLDPPTKAELLAETRLRLTHELGTDGQVELPFLRLLVWGRR